MSDSSTSEILIKIMTALESGGIDAAKAKLLDLTTSTKDSSAATAINSVEQAKMDKVLREMQSTLLRIPAALRGSPEAISGLTKSLGGLSSAMVPIGGVAAAAFAGWKLGTLIDQTFGISDAISNRLSPAIRNIEGPAKAAREELAKIDEVTFKKLEAALSEAEAKFDSLARRIEGFTSRAGEDASARARLAAAKVEAMPEGPARDRAKAEADYAATKEKAYLDTSAAQRESGVKIDESAKIKQSIVTYEKRVIEARSNRERSGDDMAMAQAQGNPEKIAIAAQAVKDSRQRLDKAEQEFSDNVPKLREKLESIDEELQGFASKLNAINTDLETAEIQRQNALNKAKQAEEESDRKKSVESTKDSISALGTQAKTAASLLERHLPVLESMAASESADVAPAQQALTTFNAGKVGGKLVAGGRIKSQVRKKLQEDVSRETQEANDAANKLTTAQSQVERLNGIAKAAAGAMQDSGSATAEVMQSMLAFLTRQSADMENIKGQLKNLP